jgi:hypothetical protein
VWSAKKETEKLDYIHYNPVKRGLVADPADWAWSSFRYHAFREIGPVRINYQESVAQVKVVGV